MRLPAEAVRAERHFFPSRRLPALGRCRCFLCGHESSIPLPLAEGQPNWIECERCGLDNEIPAGVALSPLIRGRVPTRFF